ncbi:hypothetical protein HAX54_011908, partial [Datura stramonium]|nr:hypothetical protein [Datura stramonium]
RHPKVCEVGVGGEKTEVGKGGVDIGENSRDVNVKEQISQPDFNFLSMRESAIASITQDYYKNKKGAQELESDLKLNFERSMSYDFFVDMSEFEITLITKVATGAERINMNVAINDQAVGDGSLPRQDITHPTTCVADEADDTVGRVTGISNKPGSGVFVEGIDVNESVVAPPSKDATCEPLVGQVSYEIPTEATYIFIESEHDFPGCGIPPGTTVVEIGDDDKTHAVYRRTRNRSPGKAQQSPFIVGSGLSELGLVSVKRVKGMSLLIPSITVPMDYRVIQVFSSFADEGMITKMGSVAVYSDDDDYLEPTYDFEVSSVSRKTWFHTLNYLERPISCDYHERLRGASLNELSSPL